VDEISIGEFSRRSRLSVKALRLYDELGVLLPARVDGASGYRFYDPEQLADARLIAMMRQLDCPLATIKELLACDRTVAAERVAAYWSDVEDAHVARRQLAAMLVNQLNGKEVAMYDVNTREIPERRLLCLKRHVDEQGAWDLGKEFIALMRARPLPKLPGREGAVFSLYWGEVSADSDGPVEWCRPIPEADAAALAATYPELSVRSEPAHREAFVALTMDRSGANPLEFQIASESLRAWATESRIDPESLDLNLGVRITYLASEPITETSVPDCDFAVPYAESREE
jgi:DNA-binding transcriptional MerR regulator